MPEDEKSKAPPFNPDYNLIEKIPRDWSGLALLIVFFGLVILALLKG